MRIIARYCTELGGHIYRKGEIAQWDGPVDGRIAELFSAEDGSMLAVGGDAGAEAAAGRDDGGEAALKKTINVMKREGICRALDAMGITYSPKSRTEALARLLLANRGEMEI